MLLLHAEKARDVLHGQHVLGNGNEEQVRNLIRVVLLVHGAGDIAFLHIIAHHGGGNLHAAQGSQVTVDVFDGLIQIQPHIGDFPPAGHAEDRNVNGHGPSAPLRREHYRTNDENRQSGLQIRLDKFFKS